MRALLHAGVMAVIVLAGLVPPVPADAGEGVREVSIGVLAFRGFEETERMWAPTADYLGERIPRTRFRILPLTHDTIDQAAARGAVEFVITTPGSYVALNQRYGITRIATMVTRRPTGPSTRFGAVIITRADRDDLVTLEDLRGRRLAAVHPEAFGGWWMAWRELRTQGIDPWQDLEHLSFTGFPVHLILEAVRSGDADAGTFRTELLEQWIAEGLVEPGEFRVVGARETAGFPFLHSTRLYPEWPLAVHHHVDERLARQVLLALLELPVEHPAADAAGLMGWTIPLDYEPVHALMRELQVGMYESDGDLTLRQVMSVYGPWFGAMVLLLLLAFLTFVLRLNARLAVSRSSLSNTLQSIGDAVVTTDTRGLIEYMNPVAEQMGRCRLKDVVGRDYRQVFQLVRESDRRELVNLARHSASMREVRPRTVEGLLIAPGGKEYAVKVTTSSIRAGKSRVSGCALVIHDVTELRTLTRQLRYQAAHDSLTGLVNRREFEARLSRAVEGSARGGQTHILMYMDLDWFKAINDSLGHMAGDHVLKEIADILEGQVRSTDTVARLGGDEFGVLALNCSLQDGVELADKLQEAVRAYVYRDGGREFRIGLSIGLVAVDRHSGGLEAVLKAADDACYAAKQGGRNRTQIHSQ
ncbi:diguanylate cyclase [Thioalkalivibrio thiocyanodenitrificans]|uniref:diguanylate cyclase n=1 Tax=Thioalkalivibrio thiocyanodenitrificans TaxID=243063 RepID=UPI000374F4DD|nr:diguanylate cyclase [Thioalkalivibrio thiocyanodenitrificans]